MKKLLSLFAGILVVLATVTVLMTGCGKQHKTSIESQAYAVSNAAMEILNL